MAMTAPHSTLFFCCIFFILMIGQITHSFVVVTTKTKTKTECHRHRQKSPTLLFADDSNNNSNSNNNNPHSLPPELLKIATAFESIGDDQLRYKQLLFMAQQLPTVDATVVAIPENKVPGCLSTVYIHATAEKRQDENNETSVVNFTGDSDGLLTKGLAALLIRGLSGSTAAAIQAVDPAFIQTTGIGASLTPGRNNGFLNMLAVMKKKAIQVAAEAEEESDDHDDDTLDTTESSSSSPTYMYDTILTSLQALKPTFIELTDVSYQHAGHVEGGTEESHFELTVTADAFDGLNLVKRHQLIYMMLGNVMPQIHALQIEARTPQEMAAKQQKQE